MSEARPKTNQQARLLLAPTDGSTPPNPVTLDPDALTVTFVDNGLGATFEYNPATNGLVFRPPDVVPPTNPDGTEPSTRFHVDVDGEPGPGKTILPVDVELFTQAASAVSAGESIALESKGTPA